MLLPSLRHTDEKSGRGPTIGGKPLEIVFLLIWAGMLALWSAWRLGAGIVFWEALSQYPMRVGHWYPALSGGLWLLMALGLFWGIWTRQRWTWRAGIGVVVGFFAWYWLDHWLSQTPRASGLFSPLCASVWLLLVLLVWFRAKAHHFFDRTDS